MRPTWKRALTWGFWHSCDVGSLQYLVNLSNKHDVNPYALLNSIFDAEKKNRSECGSLRIALRRRDRDHAIFLITKESRIVTQMKIRSAIWESRTETRRLYSILAERAQMSRTWNRLPSSIKRARELIMVKPPKLLGRKQRLEF